MSHRIELNWIGGAHEFALSLGELRAVQDACDAGPMQILIALRAGTWLVDYPLAVLRHGLVGGGMPPEQAKTLLARLADHHPIGHFVEAALLVLSAGVVGVPDDPVGEEEGATTPPPENGVGAASTEAAQKSGSRRRRSTG